MTRILIYISFICAFIANLSCTKTITEPYQKQEMARIKSFKISNSTKEILGAVDHENKTITVTLPAQAYMTALQPEIELAEGSTLKQGTDTLITNLLNYFIHGRSIQYPVTATDGSESIYSLIIKSDQPELEMAEISKDPNNPETINQRGFQNNVVSVFTKQINYPFVGDFEIDRQLIKGSLIGVDGKEYHIKTLASAILPNIHNSYIHFNLGQVEGRITGSGRDTKFNQVPEAGNYFIKIRYYSKEYTLKNPIKITYD